LKREEWGQAQVLGCPDVPNCRHDFSSEDARLVCLAQHHHCSRGQVSDPTIIAPVENSIAEEPRTFSLIIPSGRPWLRVTGFQSLRLPPASMFSPGVAPSMRRGFFLGGRAGPRPLKALASGDAGATDASPSPPSPRIRHSPGLTIPALVIRWTSNAVFQHVR
jgi:hypothetical protein